MDPINVLKVFIKLEKDIAAFYGKLKNISSIREFITTYEKMENQSENHAERILKDYKSFRISELDIEPLIVLHSNVKQNLLEEIKNESNILFVLQKLANAEEQLGKIYKSIAVHYRKNAEKYQMLSKAIDKIGEEEFGHRDVILNDMKKQQALMNKENQVAPSDADKGLSYQDYKKVLSTLNQLKASLNDLNLRDNERSIIAAELKTVEETMKKNDQRIGQCFTKCKEVLQFQKSSKQVQQLIDRLGRS